MPRRREFWITRAREATEKAIDSDLTGEQKLRDYLKISYALFFEAHEISMTIMTLHYLAGIEEKYRIINTQIKDIAQERIASMIEDGIRDGSFQKTNVKVAAKTIHNCLTGYLLSSISETRKPIDLQLPGALEDMCIKLLK